MRQALDHLRRSFPRCNSVVVLSWAPSFPKTVVISAFLSNSILFPLPTLSTIPSWIFRLHPLFYLYFSLPYLCEHIYLHLSLLFSISTYSISSKLLKYIFTSNSRSTQPPTTSHFSRKKRRSGCVRESVRATGHVNGYLVEAPRRAVASSTYCGIFGNMYVILPFFPFFLSFSLFLFLSLYSNSRCTSISIFIFLAPPVSISSFNILPLAHIVCCYGNIITTLCLPFLCEPTAALWLVLSYRCFEHLVIVLWVSQLQAPSTPPQ